MLLRILYGIKRVKLAERLPANELHAAFHVSLLVAGAGVAEPMGKAVRCLHSYQGVCGMLAANEACHGNPHVVIHHAVWNFFQHLEIQAMGFHVSLRVLLQEQVCGTVVAVGEREHSHVKLHASSAYREVQLAPIELAVTSWRVTLAYEALLQLVGIAQRRADIVAD